MSVTFEDNILKHTFYVIIRYYHFHSTSSSMITTMMKKDSTDKKRRRISATGGSPQSIRCLTDLPSGILAQAASFLAASSRALFAVALEDENSAANERSSAIVGNQWDILDFGDIEKDLAVKLSDAHIEKVLTCIDAVNNVKRLKLTNCVNITGAGLVPLRGSTIIEQIDLSLVGDHQSHFLRSPRPPLLCVHVLPILDSIIEREGCALMHLQFPYVWRNDFERESYASEFCAFIGRYNQMWRSRGVVSCLDCNKRLPTRQNQWMNPGISNWNYGIQSYTCYDCFKHYCYSCVIGREGERMLSRCKTCKRGYCTNCAKMHVCHCCGNSNCNDCYKNQCDKCNEKICVNCVDGLENCYQCEECDRVFCSQCSDPGVTDFSRNCHVCNDISCDDCRFRRFQLGQHECAECIKTIVPLMMNEYKRLHQENEQLNVELRSRN